MKKIKQLALLFFVLFAFIACDKDDEKSTTEINKENLLGNWKFVSSSTNGETDDNDACDLLETISFNQNQFTGTFYYGENCSQSNTYSFGYSVNENTITVNFDGGSDSSEIVKLNATELVLKDIQESDVYVTSYSKQ